MAQPASQPRQRRPLVLVFGMVGLSGVLLLSGCERKDQAVDLEQLNQRQDQLELKIQQLEQKQHSVTPRDPDDRADTAPAGPVRSITYRSGTDDDRLRIYWADGSSSDLPCTQEQATLVCG